MKRISKKLRIGKFAKVLGVSEDFVKHYHNKGILQPVADNDNGYRMFDVWQGNRIVMAKCYRKMGFSIDEIKTLMQNSSSDEIMQKLSEREEAIDFQIRELLNLRMSMSAWKKTCEKCYKEEGEWEVSPSQGYYVINYMEGPYFTDDEESQKILRDWMENSYLTTRILWTKADQKLRDKEEVIYGAVALGDKWVDLPIYDPAVMHIPSQKECFVYNYIAEWHPGQAHEMLHAALDIMHENGMQKKEDEIIIMQNVMEIYEDGKRYMCYRIEIPIDR